MREMGCGRPMRSRGLCTHYKSRRRKSCCRAALARGTSHAHLKLYCTTFLCEVSVLNCNVVRGGHRCTVFGKSGWQISSTSQFRQRSFPLLIVTARGSPKTKALLGTNVWLTGQEHDKLDLASFSCAKACCSQGSTLRSFGHAALPVHGMHRTANLVTLSSNPGIRHRDAVAFHVRSCCSQ